MLAGAPERAGRIEVIDGARGAAMLLVFLAHFVDAYYFVGQGFHPVASAKTHYIKLLTQIGTPAFVLISGITLASLYRRHRGLFRAARDRLIDRGLFLILAAHPLMTLAVLLISPSWRSAARVVFVTDTIGAAVIVGALVIGRLGTRARLALGAALLSASWGAMALFNPAIGSFAWRAKDLLIGDWRDHWLDYNYPPLPWFGLYFIATGLGDAFADAYARGKLAAFRARATLGSALAIAAALASTTLFHAAARRASLPETAELCRFLGSFSSKLPPAPSYLLFYGGLALGMFASLSWVQETAPGRWLVRWVSLFGRHSVPVFIAQFYVYYIGVVVLPRPLGLLVPVYFVATVAVLRSVATLWERRGAARLLTVGYPAFARRLRAALESAAGYSQAPLVTDRGDQGLADEKLDGN